MKDFHNEIYKVIINDEIINNSIDLDGNIHFSLYPNTSDIQKIAIVIDEISDPLNEAYGDNRSIAMSQTIQIDVFIKTNPRYNARLLRNEISQRISDLLEEKLSMTFVSSGKPEYDPDLKIYRSVRRYDGTFYKEIINN
ncbi:hypothetical protein [Staphylococcus equorum]|uniref:DUF3168 domain-containing protein n=1 Tax=Staphylococcus equorum TaxID=246432 RepID=A0A9X4R2W0_9STAP|nr:hypothetical protein [Staphylococcus equorum]MDG0860324.1 hypothetical protein [Staphylococcus equorum]